MAFKYLANSRFTTGNRKKRPIMLGNTIANIIASEGQLMTGGVLSRTVTFDTHVPVLPRTSVTVKVTGTIPRSSQSTGRSGTRFVIARPGYCCSRDAWQMRIDAARSGRHGVKQF